MSYTHNGVIRERKLACVGGQEIVHQSLLFESGHYYLIGQIWFHHC